MEFINKDLPMKKIILFIFFTITILNANSFNDGMKYFIKGKYNKALPHFIKASNNGSKAAQFYLGNMYEKGLGVEKDAEMARKLYRYSTGNKKVKTKLSVNTINTKSNKQDTINKLSKDFNKPYYKKKPKKVVISKTNLKNVKKVYSKKMRKNYVPELQGTQEVVFD